MDNVPITLGQYQLGKTLGIGAFGKVKLAHHIITGQKVAAKILNKGKIKHMEMAEKVRREINILKMCTHPHIIRLYEVIDTPTDIFVIMEFVSGGELFDYIVSRGRLPPDEARYFFHQIISGIEYCHFHKIVHRDLKPENLLLASKTEDITVKIADFGFAVKSKTDKSLTTQCGTPGYVAPEILLSKPYGKSVDMWSIGVIIFILLGGYPPFSDNNQGKLYKKIKAGQFEFHPDYWGTISKEAKDLITKLLTVDPEKRFTADQALNHPWIDLQDDKLASDLNNNLAELKKFQAQRKFKAVGRAVMAINKMQGLMTSTKKEGELSVDDPSRI